MGRNLVNKKKLALVQILNTIGMNTITIVNNVGVFGDSAATNNVFSE